jgi:hypothetical protein
VIQHKVTGKMQETQFIKETRRELEEQGKTILETQRDLSDAKLNTAREQSLQQNRETAKKSAISSKRSSVSEAKQKPKKDANKKNAATTKPSQSKDDDSSSFDSIRDYMCNTDDFSDDDVGNDDIMGYTRQSKCAVLKPKNGQMSKPPSVPASAKPTATLKPKNGETSEPSSVPASTKTTAGQKSSRKGKLKGWRNYQRSFRSRQDSLKDYFK